MLELLPLSCSKSLKLPHSPVVLFRQTAWKVQSQNIDRGTQQKEEADLCKGRVV